MLIVSLVTVAFIYKLNNVFVLEYSLIYRCNVIQSSLLPKPHGRSVENILELELSHI